MKKIILVICVLLLAINVISMFILETSNSPVSLSLVLKKVSEAPKPIDLDFNKSLNLLKIEGDWGIWNFSKNIINGFTTVLGVFIFFSTSIINVLYQVGYYFYVLGLSSGFYI